MKIICIENNFVNSESEKEEDILYFLKPDSCLLRKNNPFYVPKFSEQISFAVSLVLRVDKLGKSVGHKFAHRYYTKVGLGIDFTAEDVLQDAKTKGTPWETAKCFDQSAAISEHFLNLDDLEKDFEFKLVHNGTVVQQARYSEMRLNFDDIISDASKRFMLKIGDYIYTGSPHNGRNIVKINDRLQGYINDVNMFDFKIK